MIGFYERKVFAVHLSHRKNEGDIYEDASHYRVLMRGFSEYFIDFKMKALRAVGGAVAYLSGETIAFTI